MSILTESHSSSDEDDMLEALKEATDSQFLKESFFQRKNETVTNAKDDKTALPKSLRRTFEAVEESNEFGVTQDFKNFVAKQLAKSLDKCVEVIDHKDDSDRSIDGKKSQKISSGIKLMSDSRVNLNDFDSNEGENVEHNKRHGKRLKTLENFAERISKCEEVAVEPDWILSKASTAVWANRPKGVVYKYKKSNDGGLIEMNESKT